MHQRMAEAAPAPSREFTGEASVVLAGVSVSMLLLPSLLASALHPVVMQPMSAAMGWSRAQVSGAVAVLHAGTVVNSPIMGLLIARFGPRAVAAPALALSGLLLAATGFLAGQGLMGLYGAYLSVGLSTAGFMPFYAVASTWFQRRRALAFGAVSAGGTLAVVIVPLAASHLLGPLGWRLTYAALGFAVLAAGVPLTLLTARVKGGDPAPPVLAARPATRAPRGWLRDAVGARAFWLVLLAQSGATAATNATLVHAVGMVTEHGFSGAFGASIVSVMGLGGLLAQALSGIALDKADTARVMAPFALTAVAGLALLQVAVDAPLLLLGAMLVGIGAGGESSHLSYFVTRYFGVARYSRVYGVMMPLMTLLAAPVMVGALFDRTHSYRAGFTLKLAEKIARKDRFALKLVKEAVNAAEDAMGRRQAMMTAFALHQMAHLNNLIRYGTGIDPSTLQPQLRASVESRARPPQKV